MKIDGWKYYNHAMIPTTAPHEEVDLRPIEEGNIWKNGDGYPILARWTSDFDCDRETNWWYTIQDKPFDIMSLRSSSRRRISVGLKHFECRKIQPAMYASEMADITLRDWQTYPESYRPNTSREALIQEYSECKNLVYGAFDKDDGALSAFQLIRDCGSYYSLEQGKSNPEKQKKQVNAALIYTYITDIGEEYKTGKYLSNGQRNMVHQTNFNNDLCQYYGFRKAYCKLNIKYRFPINVAIFLLYPFRKILARFDGKLVHNINAILAMEYIKRS